MSQVAIKKVNDASKKALPIFDEIAKRFEAIRQRAFDLFEKRGRELGHDQADWLNAERELLGWPAAELAEKDGAYEMQITLPGFEAKDIEVTATPSEIVVHAAMKEEKRAEKGNVLWTEFGSNDVYRRFEVQNPINVDKVTANLENGLLRIKPPKSRSPRKSRPRRLSSRSNCRVRHARSVASEAGLRSCVGPKRNRESETTPIVRLALKPNTATVFFH